MKIKITKTEYKREQKEIEVNVPENPMYLWHNGVRIAYSVNPIWTTWNMQHYSKPEEIFQFSIIMVDPSVHKIQRYNIDIPTIHEILVNDKHPLQRLMDNILNYPEEKQNLRTREQFLEDFNLVVKYLNDGIRA